MEFNSLFFVFIWLPVFVLAAYLTKNQPFYKYILFLFSCGFYILSDVKHFPLLAGMVICTYLFGILVSKRRSSYFLYLFIAVIFLSFFKYGNYVLNHFSSYFSASSLRLVMPAGISFYVFTAISYVSDCFYGTVSAEKDIVLLTDHLTFFPTVISGPIHRYGDFKKYMEEPCINTDSIANGMRRFVLGLGKKTLIANQMAVIVNKVFSADTELSFLLAWYGLVALVLQMYYDFSSYSDMAIGIAKMIGYRVPENFDHPYLATSFSEFWKKWHISLTNWFRNYVYIPLGGNRVSLIRWMRNMLIVWLLTGIWHGSTFNFVLWGLYNCFILIFERKVFRIKNPYLGWVVTMVLIAGGWLIFKTSSLTQLLVFVKALAGRGSPLNMFYIRSLDILYLLPFVLVAGVLLFVPLVRISEIVKARFSVLYDVFLLALLLLSVVFIISGSYSAFIYFGF